MPWTCLRKGSSPKSRAVQVAERFVRAGLTVSVTPALNVQTLVHDDRVTCPACSEHVHLTEERKCPACGVYVDKITPALLRKRKKIARARERKAERDSRQKINAEDRMRMEAQAAIFRKHIRADLGGALYRQFNSACSTDMSTNVFHSLFLPCLF